MITVRQMRLRHASVAAADGGEVRDDGDRETEPYRWETR